MKKEKTFTIFWLTGETQIVRGCDAASAMNNAGIGHGAIRAMDFYSDGDKREKYQWNKEKRTWENKEILKMFIEAR